MGYDSSSSFLWNYCWEHNQKSIKQEGQKIGLKEKLKKAVELKLKPSELLKHLCPLDISFKLKIMANVTTLKTGVKHDFALLFQVTGDESIIEDPRDLESFITQLTESREIEDPTFTVAQVNLEGETYNCIYLDFKKEEKTE